MRKWHLGIEVVQGPVVLGTEKPWAALDPSTHHEALLISSCHNTFTCLPSQFPEHIETWQVILSRVGKPTL